MKQSDLFNKIRCTQNGTLKSLDKSINFSYILAMDIEQATECRIVMDIAGKKAFLVDQVPPKHQKD